MTDDEARQWLRLTREYLGDWGSAMGPDAGKVDYIAADLAMSLDVTDDESDENRRFIEAWVEENIVGGDA